MPLCYFKLITDMMSKNQPKKAKINADSTAAKRKLLQINDCRLDSKTKSLLCCLIDSKVYTYSHYNWSSVDSVLDCVAECVEEGLFDSRCVVSSLIQFTNANSLPRIHPLSTYSSCSAHTAQGHASCTSIEVNLGIITKLPEVPVTDTSRYMIEICSIGSFTAEGVPMVQCVNEAQVRSNVQKITEDLLELMGDKSEYSVLPELPISSHQYFADQLVLRRADGIPVMALAIKFPFSQSGRILTCPKVMGQCYDCLMSLRTYYGIVFPLIILTTLEKWRVVCLPDTKDFAEDTKGREFTSPMAGDYDRLVLATPEFYGHTEGAIDMLVSTIQKGMRSPVELKSLFNEKQKFIRVQDNSVQSNSVMSWVNTTQSLIQSMDGVTLGIPAQNCTDFIVLRYIMRYDNVKVVLGLVGSNLCVIKLFENSAVRDTEANGWRIINGIQCLSRQLFDKPALVMPFVACFDRAGQLSTKLEWWGFPFKNRTPATDEITERLNADLQEALSAYTGDVGDVHSVYAAAKSSVLDKGWIHGDAKPDNVGLVVTSKGVKPVFIDFESAAPRNANMTFEEAVSKMDKHWTDSFTRLDI